MDSMSHPKIQKYSFCLKNNESFQGRTYSGRQGEYILYGDTELRFVTFTIRTQQHATHTEVLYNFNTNNSVILYPSIKI
jgi:hypothetical protein